jgi:hypothetical protein
MGYIAVQMTADPSMIQFIAAQPLKRLMGQMSVKRQSGVKAQIDWFARLK